MANSFENAILIFHNQIGDFASSRAISSTNARRRNKTSRTTSIERSCIRCFVKQTESSPFSGFGVLGCQRRSIRPLSASVAHLARDDRSAPLMRVRETLPPMNIHEYQAAEILTRYGIPVNAGIVAQTPEEAETAAAGA